MMTKPLAILTIALVNFKNYAEATFSFGERFNLLSGLNGVGKTNLLDAVYYLCVGKSYFTPYDHRVVSHDASFFRLEGDFLKGDSPHKVVVKVKPGTQKDLLLDNIAVPRISDHLGFLPVVFSAPRDIDLVIGASQYRRRYIDHLLCQVNFSYLQSLIQYNHLLAMRNAALKEGYADLYRMVQTYDQQMAPLAKQIYETRKLLTNDFSISIPDVYHTLSEQRENIHIEYESKLSEQPYEVLADLNWEADKNTGRTNAGIHKDDFKFFINDYPAREFGSQGQIKSFIFTLHLTKYRILSQQTGFKPILILDDVFDKLDEHRLHRLMDILSTSDFGQVFISDTAANRVGAYLSNGMIKHIELMS